MPDLKQPCQCAFGDYWFCTGTGTIHELNFSSNPSAKSFVERKPNASVYGHISEKYVVAHIYGLGNPSERFPYKNYKGDNRRLQAMQDAAQWVVQHSAQLSVLPVTQWVEQQGQRGGV